MAGPWEKYQQAAPAADGPWSKYAQQQAPQPSSAPQAAPEKPQSFMSDVGNYLGGIKQGVYDIPQSAFLLGSRATDALGLSHEATPYFKKMFHDAEQFASDPESKYSKVGRAVGEFGATAPLGALKVAQGATLLPAIANGVAQGAAGAALTSNASDKPLWQQVGTGALTGGVVGAAAHGLSKGVEKLGGYTPPAPTVAQLKSRGDAMYKTAKGAGVDIKPERFGTFLEDLKTKLPNGGDLQDITDVTPDAAGVLRVMQRTADKGAPVTLARMDELRQIAGDVLANPKSGERRVAHVVIDAIDDYMDKLGPADVVSGDPKVATDILTQARETWARQSKGADIERLIKRAKTKAPNFSMSGYENALRREFIKFADNEKAMRRFTAPEQEAIRHVAKGGPVGNALRYLGKLYPNSIISAAPSATALYMGEPLTATGLATLGTAGRAGATVATSRNARLASELMRRGGSAPAPTVNPAAQALADALRRMPLAGGAGVLANVPSR